MSKKPKRSSTVKGRKNSGSATLKKSVQNNRNIPKLKTSSILNRIFTIVFKTIGAIGVFVGLYLAYLNLKSNLIIEYASNTIPSNQTALPIRIKNEGILPVFVERAEFIDSIKTIHGIYSYQNEIPVNVFQTIGPKKSVEKICDVMNFRDLPQSGYYIVEVEYKAGIFRHKQRTARSQFWIYRNKDSTIIWTNQKNMVFWPTRAVISPS